MAEKMIMVTQPYLPPRAEYDRMLDEIWESNWLTNQGPLHERFRQELAAFFGQPGVTLMVNGHLALDVALRGFGVTGEVITTPFTFASTTQAITLAALTPVFCDIRESDLTMDPDALEAAITPRTGAILPVHVYGHLCDVKRIGKIAKKHNIPVIYDAAHAFGVTLGGKSVAAYGDAAMFSFHATKLFHSIEGGALVYRDLTRKRLFDAYKNFGIEGEETIDFVGGNAKMNEFQAAMGLVNLQHFGELVAEREHITHRYRELLAGVPGLRMFFPDEDPALRYNYAYLPVLVEAEFGRTRDEVCSRLREAGIYARKYFYPLTTDFGCYAGRFDDVPLPVAREKAKQVLCLPIFNGMEDAQIERVCAAVNAARL